MKCRKTFFPFWHVREIWRGGYPFNVMVCRQKRWLMPINQIWPAYPFYFQCLRRPWAHRIRNRRRKICKSKHATVTLHTPLLYEVQPYIVCILSLCNVMNSVANSFHYRVHWLTPLVAVHWLSPLPQESHTLRQHTCPSPRALDHHYPNPDTHTHTYSYRMLRVQITVSTVDLNINSAHQTLTFCTAKGSLCSWSRYFSRLKNVS